MSVSAAALSKSARSEASKFLYVSSSAILFAEVFHSSDCQSGRSLTLPVTLKHWGNARAFVQGIIRGLTICSNRFSPLLGVDAHKVELPVCVARVHDHTPVLAVPDDKLAVPRRELCRQRVLQRSLAGNEEPKCALARRFGGDIAPRNLGTSFGLGRGSLPLAYSIQINTAGMIKDGKGVD